MDIRLFLVWGVVILGLISIGWYLYFYHINKGTTNMLEQIETEYEQVYETFNIKRFGAFYLGKPYVERSKYWDNKIKIGGKEYHIGAINFHYDVDVNIVYEIDYLINIPYDMLCRLESRFISHDGLGFNNNPIQIELIKGDVCGYNGVFIKSDNFVNTFTKVIVTDKKILEETQLKKKEMEAKELNLIYNDII